MDSYAFCCIARNNIKNYLLPLSLPPPQAFEYKNTFNRRIKRSVKIMLVFISATSTFRPRYMLYLCWCPVSNCPTGDVHTLYVIYPSSVSESWSSSTSSLLLEAATTEQNSDHYSIWSVTWYAVRSYGNLKSKILLPSLLICCRWKNVRQATQYMLSNCK